MCECEVIFFNRTLLLFDVSVSVVMRGSAVVTLELPRGLCLFLISSLAIV